MRRIRRNSYEARTDFIPLIDVIFVLLTFFVYSVVTMVQADVLPVRLTRMTAGQAASGAVVHAVTIDREGKLYYNRQPVDEATLDQKLAELAREPSKPRLYLAMEEQSTTDRGPLLLQLVGKAQRAGVTDFALVGPPRSTATGERTSATPPAR